MSAASVLAEIEAAVIAQTSVTAALATAVARNVTVTGTKCRVLPLGAGVSNDSNVTRQNVAYKIEMLHKLSSPTDEDTYLTGNALTDQLVLMAAAFWRQGNLTGVYEIVDPPSLDAPERIGNVIEYSVTATVALVP